MKIKLFTLLLICITLINPGLANTYEVPLTPYIRIDSGWYKFDDVSVPILKTEASSKIKSDIKQTLGIGVGVKFETLRLDFTYNHHISPLFTSRRTTNTYIMRRSSTIDAYLFNLYCDINDILSGFIPYIGTGIGVARVKDRVLNFVTTKGHIPSTNNFAYKIILGGALDLNTNIKLDASYNFINYGKSHSLIIDRQEYGKTLYKGHMINVGIRWEI